MNKIKHALKILATTILIILIGYLLESLRFASPLAGDYFEIATDLLPVVLSISIFVITWHSYDKNKNNAALFLGASLLAIGIADMYHLLSYPFMPDFITPNSHQKAAAFWGMTRLVSAFLFLVSAFIYKDSFPRLINKPVLIVSINAFIIIFLISALALTHDLPAFYYADGSFSTAGILLALLSSGIILFVGYLYFKRFQKSGQESNVCLIYGFLILAISRWIFHYDYSEHLLRAAGYYFLYLGLYKLSIELPYEKIAVADEKRIHAARERYRNLFDNANDAIITIELEYRITSWNRSAERLFGWNAQDIIGKNFINMIVPPDRHSETVCLINDIISGKTVAGIETVYLRKDGTSIDVSLTISPILGTDQNIIGLSSIIRDITERKRILKELRQSEERYRRLVEFSPDGILVHNTREITFANPAAAKILGAANPDELIGKELFQIIHPEYHEVVKKRIQEEKEGKEAPLIEEKFLRLDGTPVEVEITAIPSIHDGDIEVHSVVRDITERKHAEEQIKASLREKEILLREIHHRVKNNMQVISSLLRLQSGYIKDKKYLDMFKDSQTRIATMSLVYERLYQSESLERINFNEYIKDVLYELFQSYGIEHGTIALNINVDPISFGADTAIPCGLIVNELVTNSLKHAFPGNTKGEIRISLRKTNEDKYELVVSDDGIGIPEEIDFRKTESLGLHIVKILAENQLQGEINLDRSKGTEFNIKFNGGK